MNKQRLIVVLIVLFLLTIATGYVVFRTDINIEAEGKTASAKNLNVIFKDVGTPTEVYSTDASAVISNSRKILSISVPNLMQKGAYADFPVTIKNIGTLPARLQSINQYSVGNAFIFVNYRGISVMDPVLYPNEERNFNVRVSLVRDIDVQNIKFDFQINFNYIQAN